MMRTTRTTVTFKRPFNLGAVDESYPAGSYSIETDEELLQEVSFPAYRRIATWMQRINEQNPGRITSITPIDPRQLEAAIDRDKGWQV